MSEIDLKALREEIAERVRLTFPPDTLPVLPETMLALLDRLEAAEQRAEAAEKDRDDHFVTVTLTRTLGMYGAAFDGPGPHRAYTYQEQPGNVAASRLGNAACAAMAGSAGDSIDRGLGLLKALQDVGFGVFQVELPDAAMDKGEIP